MPSRGRPGAVQSVHREFGRAVGIATPRPRRLGRTLQRRHRSGPSASARLDYAPALRHRGRDDQRRGKGTRHVATRTNSAPRAPSHRPTRSPTTPLRARSRPLRPRARRRQGPDHARDSRPSRFVTHVRRPAHRRREAGRALRRLAPQSTNPRRDLVCLPTPRPTQRRRSDNSGRHCCWRAVPLTALMRAVLDACVLSATTDETQTTGRDSRLVNAEITAKKPGSGRYLSLPRRPARLFGQRLGEHVGLQF